MKKFAALIRPSVRRALCALAAAVLLLSLAACGTRTETPQTPISSEAVSASSTIGEGKTAFTLEVTDADGAVTVFAVHTDEKTVGEALQKLGLIDGEEGAYGLYVKTVNGITADYDTDGSYWAFYINGEYAMTGVDQTDVQAGAVYALKVEKG